MVNTFSPSDTNIFISYRRIDGLEHARIIYLDLLNHGYSNIFFDYNSLRDGPFDYQIEEAIRVCNDFIIVLSPQSMNRCHLLDDWVAHELRLAIKYSRKIIPVCINTSGFRWPSNFPSDLKIICNIQRHCMLTNEYFADSMRMLAMSRLQTKPMRKVVRDSIDIVTKVSSKSLPLIRTTLKKWGKCRLATFTDKGQGVIVRGDKDFIHTDDIPVGMKKVLNSIISIPKAYIVEVCLTEYYWFVVYYDTSWHGKGYVPERFKKDLNALFQKNTTIQCITMNNSGDYIVVTPYGYIATRPEDKRIIKEAKRSNCGKIISAQITDESALISFERGIKGNMIPEVVKDKILKICDETEVSPKLIRFTDGGLYLFAGEDSYWSYL